MDTLDLTYFLSAAELLNLRQAAQLHYVNVSTMARHITNLEEFLHLKLFIRTNTGLILTEAGESFYPVARDILHLSHNYQYNMIIKGLSSHPKKEDSQNLVIAHGAFNKTYYYLYELLHNNLMPGMQYSCVLHCVREDLMIDFVNSGSADIGVALKKYLDNRPEFDSIQFFRTNCVLYVPNEHPLAQHDSIDFDVLKKEYDKYGYFLPDHLVLDHASQVPVAKHSSEQIVGSFDDNFHNLPISDVFDIKHLCSIWNQRILPLMGYVNKGVMQTSYSAIIVLPEGTILPVLRKMHCVHISNADTHINWRLFWRKDNPSPALSDFKKIMNFYGASIKS